MIKDIRRLYNKLGQAFDRQSLVSEEKSVHQLEDINDPLSAGQAFALVLPFARKLDRNPRLKLITAADGINIDGKASRWEFFFDLPGRRAKLECDWLLTWDDSADAFQGAQIEVRVQPFPPADNKLRQMVDQGGLLYQQLEGLWKQERKRTPDLPDKFRDSDIVIGELITQNKNLLDQELSLATGLNPQGRPCWLAQSRSDTFHLDL
ncbi:MAG: hypothetical protein QNJ69_03390 [Gammaproteobacteria bacterium]|nr:hypothetical protein [Gammaproteobacteria bacterium]